MIRSALLLLIFTTCLCLSASGEDQHKNDSHANAPRTPLTVTPVRVSENRHWADPAVERDRRGASHISGAVSLRITGSDAFGASAWGNLHVLEASDDAGESIVPKANRLPHGPFADGFEYIDPLFGQPKGLDSTLIAIPFGPTSLRATKITRLRGEFQLLAKGELKTVLTTNLLAHLGKEIDSPALKRAGLKVIVDSRTPLIDREVHLWIVVKGNDPALRRVSVLDEKQRIISRNGNASGIGGWKVVLPHAIDEKMTLRLDVMVGQQRITVPFDVRDLPLP